MGNKVVWVGLVIMATIIGYVILTAVMPVVRDLSDTAAGMIDNVTYAAPYNVVKSAPWWLYFVPAVLGIATIVIILKAREPN